MNLTISKSERFDLTIRYPEEPGTPTEPTMPNISHAELIATLTIHQVPMLTAFQRRGVVQMVGGPQLSWRPATAPEPKAAQS